jgi:uncharacterized protein (DUF983 family)
MKTEAKHKSNGENIKFFVETCPKCGQGIVKNCKCGANASCTNCGYGRGSWPCDCMPIEPTKLRVVYAS